MSDELICVGCKQPIPSGQEAYCGGARTGLPGARCPACYAVYLRKAGITAQPRQAANDERVSLKESLDALIDEAQRVREQLNLVEHYPAAMGRARKILGQ